MALRSAEGHRVVEEHRVGPDGLRTEPYGLISLTGDRNVHVTDPCPPDLEEWMHEEYRMWDCLNDQENFGGAVVYVRDSMSSDKTVERYSDVFGKYFYQRDALDCFRECFLQRAGGPVGSDMSIKDKMKSIAAARKSRYGW